MQATLEKQKIRRVHCGALAACMLFPLLGSCFGSCDVYTNANAALDGVVFSVASWNVQALFDGQDNGWEYEEYRDGSGWTEDKYTDEFSHKL